MNTVATAASDQHASWCEDTQSGADATHVCIAAGYVVDHISGETGEEWANLYVGLTRRPFDGTTVDFTGILDMHGVEHELRMRPAYARTLAAALVRLADSAELDR